MKKIWKMLIADDEPNIRESLSFLFPWDQLQIQVVYLAADGKEAYDYILHHPIDLVLADIRMPVIDGLELTQLLKAERPEISIVLLSAYSDFEYARSALRCGVFAYLTKPVHYTELIDTFRRLTDAGPITAASITAARAVTTTGAIADTGAVTTAGAIADTGAVISAAVPDKLPDSARQKENYKGYYQEISAQIQEYVQKDVAAASLIGAAEATGLSPSYVSTIFHRSFGKTFSAFLAQARMEKAAQLLSEGGSVPAVSWAVGYNQPKNFIRAYRQYFNTDPISKTKE